MHPMICSKFAILYSQHLVYLNVAYNAPFFLFVSPMFTTKINGIIHFKWARETLNGFNLELSGSSPFMLQHYSS